MSENEPDWMRTFAFSIWARFAPDLKTAHSVLGKAPLGDGTVWHRALRGDTETVPAVIARLRLSSHWLHVVPRIWCAELESVVESWFEKAEECKLGGNPQANLCYELAHCLRDIPMADGLRLLIKHWGRIRSAPLFIQVALYLGTDETCSLAKESLQAGASAKEVFRFIDSFFGFLIEGLSDRLGRRQLNSLRPYLDQLDAMCIDDMIAHCHAHGYWDWSLQHLRPECWRRVEMDGEGGDERQRIVRTTRRWFPTDEDLLAQFSELENTESRQQAPSVWIWLEHLGGRDIASERCFTLLERWVKQSPTAARCSIAVAIVRHRGQRPALNILRSHCDKKTFADELLSDTEYRVKRRSLD